MLTYADVSWRMELGIKKGWVLYQVEDKRMLTYVDVC